MTAFENQPEINGYSQPEIMALMKEAVAFIDGSSIGRYTYQTMAMWLNDDLPFYELNSATNDDDLFLAFRSSGFRKFCKTMEPVFAYRALVDEAPDAFELFHDIHELGGFDEDTPVQIDSGVQLEVNRYLTMATLLTFPADAFQEGTMTHMRLDNFLWDLQKTCENPKQAILLDNVIGEFVKSYFIEGDEAAAYYFEECSPIERNTVRNAILAMKGIIIKAPLLYGASYSSYYSITLDAFDNAKKADQNMVEQEAALIEFLEPYLGVGAVESFVRASGSSVQGRLSATFNFKANRMAAQDLADKFPKAKVHTKTGLQICCVP